MFLIGFVAGLMTGGILGFIIFSFMQVSKDKDKNK